MCLSLLAGCVAADGRKPLKQETADFTAARYNVQLGTAYLQQGNYALAKEKLERSVKQNPKDPDVHTSLGLLYDRTGDGKAADKHFREALRLAPDKPDLGNNYAIYLCKNGRVDEGVERFTAVAANKYYRTPEVALTNAGVCLYDAKRLDEAQKKFMGAIKARPNYSDATVQLSSLYVERSQLVEARKVVDTYLNAFKPNPDVLFAGVKVARASKDKLAEEKYTRTLRMEFPESAQARALKRGT
jgi:type IV pilus assembly protein PilF